jgi:hypothetical protein
MVNNIFLEFIPPVCEISHLNNESGHKAVTRMCLK